MLSGTVDCKVGHGNQSGHTGDVDDGALATGGHVGDESVAEHGHWQRVD